MRKIILIIGVIFLTACSEGFETSDEIGGLNSTQSPGKNIHIRFN